MQELVLKDIEAVNYKPKTYDELLAIYKDKERFDQALKELILAGKIYLDAKGKYRLSAKDHRFRAKIVRVKEGFAFATLVEEAIDIYIAKEDLKNALINDLVLLYVEPNTTKGAVIDILERGNTKFVGEIVTSGKYTYVSPDEIVISLPIFVVDEGKPLPMEGYKVVVEIVSYHDEYIEAKIIEVLGHKNDPGMDILSIVKEHQVPYEFPTTVLEEADQVPDEIQEEDIIGRVDYRDRLIVTIDGDDSKDFDDAVELTINEDGTYRLGVHIADVSYYVKEKSHLDLEALSRGNSIYLADRVIPMLPFRLSNGICSLNPGLNRLTLSCIMKVTKQGEVIDYQISESVIKSHYRLTYSRVNRLYNEQEKYEDEALNTMLWNMKKLSDIVKKRKIEKGTLNLDVKETKIVVDKTGKAIDIKARESGISEGIIEQFMILANETVASHIFWQNLPCIYRIHPQPQLKKLRLFATLIKPLGYTLRGDQNGVHPSQLQQILEEASDQENKNVVTTLLLRSLPKAMYSANNEKHFGLASDCYSHFTSPIRRYSDLLLHRLVRLYQSHQSYDEDALLQKITYIAEHTSITERKSIEMEREVNDLKMAEFMEDHIGEEFSGVISGFNQVGMYIELENTVEGFIRFYTIDRFDEYFYDDRRMIAQSTSGKVVKLGDKVIVRVAASSKKLRQIDFALVKFLKKKDKDIKVSKQAREPMKRGKPRGHGVKDTFHRENKPRKRK